MFETRANGAEFLDSVDCDPQLAYTSYRFMRLVNRFAGGTQAVKDFLAREISKRDRNRPIRVLDIGSGTCDVPLAVTKWAQRRSQKIEFTCIEINKTALKKAAENVRKSGFDSIKLKNETILEFDSQQHFDYAIGSMFFHHFKDDQILEIIEKLRSYVLRGVLINDLRRSFVSYMSCLLLVCPLSKGVRHDALISIRKGFKPDGLRRLLSRIDDADVTVKIQNFSRLTAAIRFDQEG
jgi:SAM-dependent methyltransferase